MGFIFSTDESSDELVAATNIVRQLKNIKQFQNENDFTCKVLIEANVGNRKTKTSDIVMVCSFKKPMRFEFKPALVYSHINDKNQDVDLKVSTLMIENFIACIEVKFQGDDKIRFSETNSLEVFYPKQDYWSDASKQHQDQLHNTRRYISRDRSKPPLVGGFIYLHNIKKNQFENSQKRDFPINLRCNDHGMGFIESIAHQIIQFKNASYIGRSAPPIIGSCFNKDEIDYYIESNWVQTNPRPSKFDMARMNAIVKNVEEWHYDDLSKRMIEYRGLGGTGKTIKLLQIAHQTYLEEQKNVLFLTYNWALIIGLRLTMVHMSIPHASSDRGGIDVDSCSSFFWGILKNLGYISKKDSDRIDKDLNLYDEIYKKALTECVKDLKKLDEIEIKELLRESTNHNLKVFSDIVLVDEGQDWMPEEQFILESIFQTKNILIAYGKGQETRGNPTIWGKHLTSSNHQNKDCDKRVHTLHKAMRMRGNLGSFIKTFADLTLTDEMYKRLEPNTEALEGEVIIIEGDYFDQKDLRNELSKKVEEEAGDVFALDLLHIVPPKMSVSDFDHGLNERLIWDGIDRKKRKETPTSENMLRWINYRSCRGLEGWITFNHYLDDYWEYEFNTQKIDIAQGSLFENATDEQKRKEAFRWILIALTRPIDSTIITLRDKDSELGRVLQDVYKKHPSFIRWID